MWLHPADTVNEDKIGNAFRFIQQWSTALRMAKEERALMPSKCAAESAKRMMAGDPFEEQNLSEMRRLGWNAYRGAHGLFRSLCWGREAQFFVDSMSSTYSTIGLHSRLQDGGGLLLVL